MRWRVIAGLLSASVLGAGTLAAQEHPVRRVANIVSVAVEEYKLAVDGKGRLISAIEYEEATTFLADARTQAARLPGDRAAAALAILDSILKAVETRQPPDSVKAMEERFSQALGSEAALELPTKAIDLTLGKQLYE